MVCSCDTNLLCLDSPVGSTTVLFFFFPFSRSFDECRVNVMCYKIVSSFWCVCVSVCKWSGVLRFQWDEPLCCIFRSLSGG